MDSREQFEQWAEAKGYRVDYWDGTYSYMMSATKWLWEAWQASREALVVKLPDGNKYHFGSTEGDAKQRLYDAGENTMLKDVKDVLDQVGVRYE